MTAEKRLQEVACAIHPLAWCGEWAGAGLSRERAMEAHFSWCCPPKPFLAEEHVWPATWRPVTDAQRGELLTADLRVPQSNGSWPEVMAICWRGRVRQHDDSRGQHCRRAGLLTMQLARCSSLLHEFRVWLAAVG